MKAVKTMIGAIAIACSLCAPALALDPDQVRAWREDIDFYRSSLEELHIDLFHTVSQARFDEELDSLVARLPDLNEHELVVELMRITRLVGDGHTQFPIMSGPHQHFPLKFSIIDGAVLVSSASDRYRDYLGAELVGVDGVPIEEVIEILSPIVQPAENEYGLLHSLAFHLTVDNMLFGSGITDTYGAARFDFVTATGRSASEKIASVSMSEFVSQTTQEIESHNPFASRVMVSFDGLWFAIDEAKATAYLSFASYPDPEDMPSLAREVAEYLEANEIRYLIIDLRENGGGNFYTGLTLSGPILMTDSLDWNQGVYVLTGRATYSAAMTNAVQFRQLLNARLVGEPTGGNPVSYSELGFFHLPNSGRMVTYSERYYRLQSDVTTAVEPDVLVQPSRDEFIAGRDTVIDWVISDIQARGG